ncbi:pre-rRNA-processing protein TSR1 homolog [Babesia caballi]|uniref:Pre-rRNA-processing protein TSR1 homolog n=1 Tax=Babesia caballi TaxID=5871 RepID=A0AAV4LWX7_BABCB|nr:pre-rRNA-processing protein TSR1 homolog [Babesia caballi]
MTVHRAVLKQKHKPFKNGKGNGVRPKRVASSVGKDVSLHRRYKKSRMVAKTKSLRSGIQDEPPRLVFVLPFHGDAGASDFIRACAKHLSSHSTVQVRDSKDGWTIASPMLLPASMLRDGLPRRVVLFSCPRTLSDILYATSVADVLVCLFRGSSQTEPAFDDFGYKALSVVRQQGVPPPVGIDLEVGLPGDRASSCTLVRRYFHDELGNDKKFVPVTSQEDLSTALTAIGGVSLGGLTWRSSRGYLLSLGQSYDPQTQQLSVVGYARGVGFSVRHPVHVTGFGDFLLQKIDLLADVCPVKRASGMQADSTVEEMTDDIAKELTQEVDSLSHPAPSVSEADDGIDLLEEFEKCVRIGGADEDGDVDMDGDFGEGDDPNDDSGLGDMDSYFSNLEDVNPNQKRIEFEQRALEDLSFPDEVDTPVDIPARERFRKYRALRSIKEGAWDPYESLPPEYLQICEFENFRTTMTHSRKTVEKNCGQTQTSGKYVQLTLSNVSPECYARICNPSGSEEGLTVRPLIVSVVFPFERKVSVLSMSVTRSFEGPDAIASKRDVLLYCGFRRFPAKPTYSQDVAAERGRFGTFSRFVHKGHTTTASIYGMALLPNTPVVGLDAADPSIMLYGGMVTGAEPSRIILKRIVLTGYPFRVHKRLAVVRYMFFNPRDIKYFKPAQLHTKRGLRGAIKEPLGTHGYMKCIFNDSIRQDDIVCLALFKRVYPKWFPASWSTWLS